MATTNIMLCDLKHKFQVVFSITFQPPSQQKKRKEEVNKRKNEDAAITIEGRNRNLFLCSVRTQDKSCARGLGHTLRHFFTRSAQPLAAVAVAYSCCRCGRFPPSQQRASAGCGLRLRF
jgi:hypothetical protein